MASGLDAMIERSAQRGIDYVAAHPGTSFEFDTSGIIIATNDAGKKLDAAIEGNEGHSGSTYSFAFRVFLQKAKEKGFNIFNDSDTGALRVSFNGAAAQAAEAPAPPDVTTGHDIAAMKPVQYKKKP